MNSRRCSEISVLINLTASHSCRGGGWLNIHDVHPEGSTASMHWVAAVWLADQLFVSMCSWADPAAAATYKKNLFYEFAGIHIWKHTKKKMKHTLIHLNDPNLRCSLTLVLVRQKGQSSLVVIARGGTMRSIYGRSVIFLHIAILASMTLVSPEGFTSAAVKTCW